MTVCFRIIPIVVFALFYSSLGFAQNAEPMAAVTSAKPPSTVSSSVENTDSDVVIVKSVPTAIVEDSSEHNRMGKKYEVDVMLVGIGPNTSPGRGVSVGLFNSRNRVYSLNYVNGTRRMYCSGTLSCTDTSSALGVSLKSFAGNSFYYTFSLDYRRVGYTEQQDWGGGAGLGYDFGYEAEMLAAGFVIGNQWHWKSFTMGCDWIGLSVPFYTHYLEDYFHGTDSIGMSNKNTSEQTYVKNPGIQALRFYVGATF